MTKRVFLYVRGDDYSALSFQQEFDMQKFYEEMKKEEKTEETISTDEVYAEVEIKEFTQIDDNFINFIRNHIMDYDSSKHTDFFEVNPI